MSKENADKEQKRSFKREVFSWIACIVLVKDGKVYINGSKKALSEPYIKEEPVEDFGPYKVPKNGYFVMGDNRNNSNDAREWETHYVSRDEVLGKAWFRYYPSIKVIK